MSSVLADDGKNYDRLVKRRPIMPTYATLVDFCNCCKYGKDTMEQIKKSGDSVISDKVFKAFIKWFLNHHDIYLNYVLLALSIFFVVTIEVIQG
jgi:hypothetical protein